jgi:hypothetical protein
MSANFVRHVITYTDIAQFKEAASRVLIQLALSYSHRGFSPVSIAANKD